MIPASYNKLLAFKEKLGLDEMELEKLEPFREIFISKKDEFSDYFYKFFLNIPETKKFLEHYETPGFLKKAWANWFESLFSGRLDDKYLSYLWKIGVRHVEVNLDQRFSNLGFSVARQFCQQIILSEIPPHKIGSVSQSVDKLLDFCLLVETDAYIEATVRCDMEVIKGIADRIRNRVTVIGGNIKRLQRKIDINDPSYNTYESLISESSSLEHMIIDLRTYIDMSQQEPEISKILLKELIGSALERLQVKERLKDIQMDVHLYPDEIMVLGDKGDLENIFYYLLQNSIEAVDPKNPYIKVSATLDVTLPHRVHIEVFNTGTPPKIEDMVRLFSPFFSTKPLGTGLGLAIARLAARKNYGKLFIEPIQGQGTKAVITLPIAE